MTTIKRFSASSMAELVRLGEPVIRAQEAGVLRRQAWLNGARDNWLGGRTWFEFKAAVDNGGDEAGAQEAAAIVDGIVLEAAGERPSWAPSVVGAFPCVPDVLAGFPEPMRARCHVPDEGLPVSIAVCLTSSSGVSNEALRARGIAILALCMALRTEGRNVELSAFTVLDGGPDAGCSLVSFEVATNPLSMAEACFAFSAQEMARGLMYGISGAAHGSKGHWPRGMVWDKATEWFAKQQKAGLFGADLVVPPIVLNEDREVMSNPAGWVSKRLAMIRSKTAAAA